MGSESERLLSALRTAMKENARLRAELESGPGTEPVAIVGTGCRLPGGVDTPERLWELVSERREAVGPFPEDRGWDLAKLLADGVDGRLVDMDRGSFLRDVFDFDPAFFGISPREAEAMEPQQRFLLELAWETLERAGIAPTSLTGSETGVYVGLVQQEYGPPVYRSTADGVTLTGVSSSVASGRISYCLGLVGPALTVDTACSSSLVSLHLAVRALRQGDCSLALAGGATIMSTPGTLAEFTRLRGVAPDGRCKAFGRDADGAAFSEGAGMVVLERLSDARRNGHKVLAVVRGGAVNQDGASNGLTAPNGPSQTRVIGRALADAGLTPADVDLVEAHGTGTALGDPIEAQALIAAYGRGRPEGQALGLGSLKSNIGHPQAAAGVAGVIKTVEALRHGVMPPTLHADEPSTYVDWDSGVRLLQEPRPWPDHGRPRRAAVSSFGMSGTNAHLILEQAPEPPTPDKGKTNPADVRPRSASVTGAAAWPLSARTPQALAAQAARLREHLRPRPELAASDVGFSLVTARSALECRAVAVGRDRDELLAALSSLEAGTPGATVATGRARSDRRTVLVFPGQGGQWEGMAVELLDASAEFARHVDACERALEPHVDWRLTDVLRGAEGAPALDRVDVVQPALWAVMVSLARLWMAHGLVPAAVVGHSQGEVAAAHIAGALTLEDAAKVVALRSQAVLELAGTGAMASVASPVMAVRDRLGPWTERVHVATVNSPSTTVIAGEPDAVARVVEECEADGVRARMIAVDYASHTPFVDVLRDRVRSELSGIVPARPEIPFYSTLTGELLDRPLDADYWFQGLRETVRFAEATEALITAGHNVFVEVGPHLVLTPAIQETAEAVGADDVAAFDTLRRDDGGPVRFLTALGQAHSHGVDLDWTPLFDTDPTPVDLPTYAFQRQRYWRPGPATEPLERSSGNIVGAGNGGSMDDWIYREEWVDVPASPAGPGNPSGEPTDRGTWLFVGSRIGRAIQGCVTALEAGGYRTRVLDLPADAGRDSLAALVDTARNGAGPISGVLLTTALDRAPDEIRPPSTDPAHKDALLTLQALIDTGIDTRLWCLTSGAVDSGSGVNDPAAALLWGFGRVTAQEHTDHWGGLVDLADPEDPESGTALASILTGATAPGEDQLAVHGRMVLARRLVRAPLGEDGVRDWKPSGTVLVTGGTGGLGAHTARRLAELGAQHLLLLSRRGPEAPGAEALAAELRAVGARVTLVACDVGDRAELAETLSGVPEDLPLTAVFHTAAELDDGALADLGPADIARVLRAKADGAVHLHALTRGLNLSAFVLYSSVGAVFGVTGQGNYAPGNVFCESFAHYRRSLGLPTTSIAWGAWEGDGMAGRQAVAGLLRRHGLPTMKPEPALDGLFRVLNHDVTASAVADVDWPRFRVAFTANRPSPLITDLAPSGTTVVDGAPLELASEPVGEDLRGRLSGAGRAERVRALTEHVCDHVAAILGYPSGDAVPSDRGLKDLGMDSVTAVELRNRISTLTGARLPSAVAFDHPTCEALARHVEERVFGSAEQVALERLDGLAAALDEYEGTESAVVADRLRALLGRLDPGVSDYTGARAEGPDLEATSREELFSLIDETLDD